MRREPANASQLQKENDRAECDQLKPNLSLCPSFARFRVARFAFLLGHPLCSKQTCGSSKARAAFGEQPQRRRPEKGTGQTIAGAQPLTVKLRSSGQGRD